MGLCAPSLRSSTTVGRSLSCTQAHEKPPTQPRGQARSPSNAPISSRETWLNSCVLPPALDLRCT